MTSASGLLLVDKPEGWTSHDVVAKTRGLAKTRRVGHAGTLDPMATGLLILGINQATKLLTFLVGEDKTYEGTIRLGASTITDDRESDFLSVTEAAQVQSITAEKLEAALDTLRGPIMQIPSSVSAIKVDGERAYAKVRGGDEVKLAARPVTISRFGVTSQPQLVIDQGNTFLDVPVTVDCSSGTYIRALARDLGAALGVGGHLTSLRRTRIGRYSLANAKPLADLSADNLEIMPMVEAARAQFSVRDLSDQDVVDLRHGKRIELGGVAVGLDPEQPIAAITAGGELIGMLTQVGSQLRSLVIFVSPEGEK
jgi:tRNA pseudouridine55 synthase